MRSYLFILSLIPIFCKAQSPNWQNVVLEPNIEIRSMLPDSLGFIWMNDVHSLYRFDGKNTIKKLSLDDEQISSITYAHTDDIVIGTSYGRVILFNPYTFTRKILHEDEAYSNITNSLVYNNERYITVSYGQGVSLHIDGKTKFLQEKDGLISNEVYDIIDYKDRIYISSDQGIQILDFELDNTILTDISKSDGLSDFVIPHMIIHENEIWYTDYDQNIGKIKKGQIIENFRLPVKAKINSITPDDTGIYIATNEGLFHFEDGKFQLQYKKQINETQIDEEGNLWITDINDNLIKGNLYFQKLELDVSDIRAITSFDNKVVIGNESGVYQMINQNPQKVISESVTCLSSYKDYLLVGTFSDGVKVYNSKFQLIDHKSQWNNIENESILSIQTLDSDIYVSSLSGVAVFEAREGKLKFKTSMNAIIGQAYIYTMLFDNEQFYFCTDRDGIYKWEKDKDEVTIINQFVDGSKIGSVYSITKDKQDKIWFTSTETGVGYIKNNKAIKLDQMNNSNDEYTSIKVMNSNNLMLIKDNSIAILDPETEHFMYFDKELGLADNAAYLNTIVSMGAETVFAHNNSLFSYKSAPHKKIHPEVIIDQTRINLSPVEEDQYIFQQNENNIEFDYIGSWLTDPQKITYQYKLEGFDEEWRNTKDNSVSYPRLPPQEYKFRVRASENGLFHDEPEAQFGFRIKKKWYNQWWVRALGFGLIGFIIYTIVKQREVTKKRQLEQDKLNIENQFINLRNQLNPHFLFNSFNTLIGLIEEDQDRSVTFVEKMSDFYRNMIEYGKSNLISLDDEKEVLYQYIDILRARFKGQLQIKSQWEDDTSIYKIPPMTLQLLVENAVKHNEVSTRNPLQLSITQTSDSISIKNKKTPLLHSQPSTKTGLQNIKLRFELINLEVPIIMESEEYFEVKLKLKTDESRNT